MKKFNECSMGLSVVLFACMAFSPGGLLANPELVTNGNFEDGNRFDLKSNSDFVPAGASCIPGWTVTSRSIDYITGFPQAQNEWEMGSRAVIDVCGNEPGGLSQTIKTSAGSRYKLSFDMTANPIPKPEIKTVRVSAGSGSKTFTFSSSDSKPACKGARWSGFAWKRQTYYFVADSSSTKLEFTSLTEGCYGPVIDNVSVVKMQDDIAPLDDKGGDSNSHPSEGTAPQPSSGAPAKTPSSPGSVPPPPVL